MTSYLKNKSLVTIFCDASCDEVNCLIGVGVSITGMGKHIIESELKQVSILDPIFGELLALEFSLKSLSKILDTSNFPIDNIDRIIIFSDCNIIKRLLSKSLFTKVLYTNVIDEINNLLEKLSIIYQNITFSVKYIGHRKKIIYYKAAHHAARKIIGKK